MIDWNPCGAICDYGRRAYTTTLRPFVGSDITCKIAWYPAAPGARHLPIPSAFMSRDWVADPEECTTVGEVYDTPRYYNARMAIPHAVGAHICGTEEQWRGEAKYDPAVNVEYNADGLPSCCGVAAQLPGGVLLGGVSAVYGYTPAPYPAGLYLSGSAVVSYLPPPAAAELELSGSAVVDYLPPPGRAHLELSGSSVVEYWPPPGETCETALALASGVPYDGTLADGETRWFSITLPAGGPYRVSVSLASGAAGVSVFKGACGSLFPFRVFVAPSCTSFNLAEETALKVQLLASADTEFTLTVEEGACP